MKFSAKSVKLKHSILMLVLTIVIAIGTSGCCSFISLGVNECGSWVQLYLVYADEVSEEPKIQLKEDKLEVKVKLGYSYLGFFGYMLDVKVKSRDIDDIILQPDSIVVLHQDNAMLHDIKESKKNHFRILYWPKNESESKYGPGKYDYYNPKHRIVLDKFIKVDGEYVAIDTVFVDAGQ